MAYNNQRKQSATKRACCQQLLLLDRLRVLPSIRTRSESSSFRRPIGPTNQSQCITMSHRDWYRDWWWCRFDTNEHSLSYLNFLSSACRNTCCNRLGTYTTAFKNYNHESEHRNEDNQTTSRRHSNSIFYVPWSLHSLINPFRCLQAAILVYFQIMYLHF